MEKINQAHLNKRSYYHIPQITSYAYVTLHEAFDITAQLYPTKNAAVFYQTREQRESMTFSELKKQSISLAESLRRRGYSRGDRVAFSSPNCIEFFPLTLALSRLGCNMFMLSNLNNLCDDVLEYKCRALMLYVGNDKEREIYREIASRVPQGTNPLSDIVVFGPYGDDVLGTGASLNNLIKGEENVTPIDGAAEQVDPDDPMCVFFTSGSTGKPKGIQLTHNAYINWARMDVASFAGADSVLFNDRPMTWLGGHGLIMEMAVCGTTALTVSSSLVVAEGEVDFVFTILKRESVTNTVMMHYFIVDLLNYSDAVSFCQVPSLRYIVTGGQVMDRDQLKKLLTLFPNIKQITVGYGSTDAGPIALQDVTYDTRSDKMQVIDGVEVKVVEPDTNRDVPPGSAGEICVRNPMIYRCLYMDNEAASQAAFDEAGWFHTGDIGTMTTDGQLSVSGRKDDMIKRATVKVFPAEVEAVIAQNPAVKDVIVVGVPDIRLREELCACVIMESSGDVEGLESWCKKKFSVGPDGLSLAPKYYLQFEEFPLTGTGKTQRKSIREKALEKLKL
ncbi:uncharacterized protein LOC106152043 [Lingula anatina]|uniref:Uncharacterized protein LOC106152043 n=1 Tax=Lingula anatina TaxID=7574 RepID=A0A1S3H662_LINAN|nr:uncharacterized protein LOC106152043 [Lingula anatina]|eukprot:XP_013380966.1 uncharacterized protein LOC106152043 [Lingula anatina]